MAVSKTKKQLNEDLYVCMSNVVEKRKSLLECVKESLIIQKEFEDVKVIREKKALIRKEVKKKLDILNKEYQNLKKMLPNVKNIISYTEKEIGDLDSQINILESNKIADEKNIALEKSLKKKLEESSELGKKAVLKKLNKKKEDLKEEPVVVHKNISSKKKSKLSQIQRIENNLKVIESKLKNI